MPYDHSDSPLDSGIRVAGVDEVGRGALFGPVVAAAVILPDTVLDRLAEAGVTDSKLLKASQREQLYDMILSSALSCRIGIASVREIDRLNILQASLLAMRRAILKLEPLPTLCLVDGNQRLPNLPIEQETWVKGDQRSLPIAAASILAKVWRDRLIIRLAARYPHYDLATNKGYGTPKHCTALSHVGLTPLHRLSFKACREVKLAQLNCLESER